MVSTGQDENSRADIAKDEARQVGQEGAAAGRHVADTAKGEARNVAEEAKGQAQSLVRTLQHDLNEQAGTQQKRAAEGLKSVSDELRSMAESSEQNGIATQWVHEAATRLGSVAGWLDERDPSSVLEETKRFARNRPGTFLAIAAGAGLVAGRLARSLKENSSGSDSNDGVNAGTGDPATGGPETSSRTAPEYPSQPPVYPANTPNAAPSRVDPTFPDEGPRGLN